MTYCRLQCWFPHLPSLSQDCLYVSCRILHQVTWVRVTASLLWRNSPTASYFKAINARGFRLIQLSGRKWICTFPQMLKALKQHYVTLTATNCFEKQNLMMHVNTSHKTAILVKSGHNLQRKCPPVFPLMFLTIALSLCSLLFLRSCHQQRPGAAVAASVCRKPTCCFQEPLWITELRQSLYRTSST